MSERIICVDEVEWDEGEGGGDVYRVDLSICSSFSIVADRLQTSSPRQKAQDLGFYSIT